MKTTKIQTIIKQAKRFLKVAGDIIDLTRNPTFVKKQIEHDRKQKNKRILEDLRTRKDDISQFRENIDRLKEEKDSEQCEGNILDAVHQADPDLANRLEQWKQEVLKRDKEKSEVKKKSSCQQTKTAVDLSFQTITGLSVEVVELLQQALQGEYQQWDLYYAYKERLKGPSRESVAEHFEEHAEDEQQHIEMLQRYLITSGNTPTVERKKIPDFNGDIDKIIKIQLKFELDAVELYNKILEQLESEQEQYKQQTNKSLIIDIENVLAKEMEHAQDLIMMIEKGV
jgi:bacterioferritin (cytochrome b1)